jgi:hypothetical protein
VTAGEEREALAEIADRLCAETGYAIGDELPDHARPRRDEERAPLFADLLAPEQEGLILTARRSLARLAAALGARHPKAVTERTYRALLDGSELVMRNELAAGNRVLGLMPSFVFLIAIPMLTQDEALELSRRTAVLLEEAPKAGER